MLENLIGCKLLYLSTSGFTVEKDSNIKHFDFVEDFGDCCGYNNISCDLYINFSDNINENPIITNVETLNETDVDEDADCCIITFFGLDKKIAEVTTYSSSGSGWCYGACVEVKCRETKESELLSCW